MTDGLAFPAALRPLVLASASVSRARMLKAAGLTFTVCPSSIDEAAVRAALSGETVSPADVAEILARAKAEEVSASQPAAIVIGADQILELDGVILSKPANMAEARGALLRLSGCTHRLHSAVSVAHGGTSLWSRADSAALTMRDLSPEFIGRYLAAAGQAVLGSVGAYQIEGLGIHLFSEVRGDHFTILGLPLLPLLDWLRREGAIGG